METEKEEMRRIKKDFEEKTTKMAPMMMLLETVTNVKQVEQIALVIDGQEEQEGDIGSQVINEESCKSPKIKKKTPIQALRRSDRALSDGMLVQTKAEQAKTKYNEFTCMSWKPFTSLQNVETDKLIEVAKDSLIILGPTTEDAESKISAMQAKEMAQAVIMATKRKLELEREAVKDK